MNFETSQASTSKHEKRDGHAPLSAVWWLGIYKLNLEQEWRRCLATQEV